MRRKPDLSPFVKSTLQRVKEMRRQDESRDKQTIARAQELQKSMTQLDIRKQLEKDIASIPIEFWQNWGGLFSTTTVLYPVKRFGIFPTKTKRTIKRAVLDTRLDYSEEYGSRNSYFLGEDGIIYQHRDHSYPLVIDLRTVSHSKLAFLSVRLQEIVNGQP